MGLFHHLRLTVLREAVVRGLCPNKSLDFLLLCYGHLIADNVDTVGGVAPPDAVVVVRGRVVLHDVTD